MSYKVDQSLLENDLHVQATYLLTEALVSSEKKMRRRIELLSEVVFEIDRHGKLSFLNHAWEETLGYKLDLCLGVPLRDFVDLQVRSEFDLSLAAALSNRGSRPQLAMCRQDGRVISVELSAANLEDGGVVGTLRDITEQKSAQAELAKLSLVASFTDNLVIITDRLGVIEWVNQAFIQKTGYSNEEAIGRKPGSFLQGPGTDSATVDLIGSRLREGRSFQCEILNYTKSGKQYWVGIHATPICNQKGEVERYVAIQTDITELRRTQQDLKAAKEAAESSNDAKTQFLATISHEMRTPLNVILGTTELVMEGRLDAECERQLGRINENAEALLGLISDLLDVSKIEAGQFDWEKIPFQLRTSIQQALAPIAESATRKGLAFHMKIDPQLPDVALGDPARLRQIVTNLAENAVKFTDTGFVSVDATAFHPGPGSHSLGLAIRVTDSGAGIPPHVLPHVFDRFFQGDSSTTRRKGGAGLGLSIVKSLVDAQGGTASARSLPGGGAEFQICLPLEQVIQPGTRPETEPARTANHQPELFHSACKILVAEDNDDNYSIVQRHLTNQGYRVDRAANGRIAVSAAANQRYDLILMDLEMPEMDGFEATRVIRASEDQDGAGRVPIFALTAHAVQGYRERCLSSGCTGYLAKPVRKQQLLEAVSSALFESGTILPEPPTASEYVEVDPDLADLVPGFLGNCGRSAEQVQEALVAGDWKLVTRIGHSMKGSAPSYGFHEISKLGRQIEQAGNTREATMVESAAVRLTAYLQRVRFRALR